MRTRELPSGHFSEPTLRVKLAQRRDADPAFVFFREKHFGHQGFTKKKRKKEKQTQRSLTYMKNKTLLVTQESLKKRKLPAGFEPFSRHKSQTNGNENISSQNAAIVNSTHLLTEWSFKHEETMKPKSS